MRSFLQNHNNTETEIFAFCVITFEPIEVQTRSAPQNDRLNLSFVKDIYVDGRKLARNGRKTAILVCRKFWLSVSNMLIRLRITCKWVEGGFEILFDLVQSNTTDEICILDNNSSQSL